MNKYSLPAILFTGLLLAGCSHSDPAQLWDKGDVTSVLKQQYGETASIVVSEGCDNADAQISALPCAQLVAVASKNGGAKIFYCFYSGPDRGFFQNIGKISFSVPGMKSSVPPLQVYFNSDKLHPKQLVILCMDSAEEKSHDQVATAFGLKKPRITIQDVQLEEVKEEENHEPPPPPPPIVDSSAQKKPNKK